jgi:hypothetical protein
VGKDKKKKHKKKHKKQEEVSTGGWTHITISAMPLPFDVTGYIYLRTPVPQMFQDAFQDGELEP